MPDRLEHYLRTSTNVNTFRFSLSDLTTTTASEEAGSTGLAFELFGVDGKHVKLRHVQISKPSIDISPLLINKYSIASTTGSATGTTVRISPLSFRGSNSSYSGEVRIYTDLMSPTTGTLLDQLQEIDIASGDVMNEHYGDDQTKFAPTLQGSSESFGFVVTSTAGSGFVLNGYVEFTEEP